MAEARPRSFEEMQMKRTHKEIQESRQGRIDQSTTNASTRSDDALPFSSSIGYLALPT